MPKHFVKTTYDGPIRKLKDDLPFSLRNGSIPSHSLIWDDWEETDEDIEKAYTGPDMIAKYPSRGFPQEVITDAQTLKAAAMKGNDLKEGILAAVKITNTNLINLHNRLQNKRTQRIILQTEALSIFKGNIIRVLKVIFDTSDISRIKSSAMFLVEIDSIHPVVTKISLVWVDRGFRNDENFKRTLKDMISNQFSAITASDLNEQAVAALKEVEIIERPANIQNVTDVNFDSIKQIKFNVR